MLEAKTERRAIFLDRDGVLNEDVGYVHRLADLRILPGVAEALTELKNRGFLLIVISNQSGVARGFFDEPAVLAFNAALVAELQRLGGPALDDIYFCPHLPDAPIAAYKKNCACRKPAPGMILQAAAKHGIALERSYLIGDKADDVECAVRAKVKGVQVRRAKDSRRHPEAFALVQSLQEALPLLK